MSSNLNHNFIIGPTDTDSLSFCKPDMTPFTQKELDALLKEINDLSPELIEWEDDGYYKSCIALKAKNYVLFDGKKKTVKGSGFKTSSKEPAMKQLMNELVDEMLNNNDSNTLTSIYHKFVVEATNVQDIHRWSAKKTITRAILDCRGYTEDDILTKKIRRNETTVWDALVNEADIQEGNKIYVYPTKTHIGSTFKTLANGKTKETKNYAYGLKLDKHFNSEQNDLDVEQLLKRCYNTVEIFALVLNIDELFVNYSLRKNQEKLQDLIQNVN